MLIFVALALFLASPLVGADGKQLLESCNDYVRHAGGTVNVPEESHFSVAWCMGFVIGAEAMAVHLSNTLVSLPLYCKPPNVTAGQIILIVTKYLNDHPETLHEPASQHVFHAMQGAFPCKGER